MRAKKTGLELSHGHRRHRRSCGSVRTVLERTARGRAPTVSRIFPGYSSHGFWTFAVVRVTLETIQLLSVDRDSQTRTCARTFIVLQRVDRETETDEEEIYLFMRKRDELRFMYIAVVRWFASKII